MNNQFIEIRPTGLEEDLLEFLDRSGLPTKDLDESKCYFFEVLENSKRIGVGGLEPKGSNALLRSIAIDENYRGEGIGTQLVNEIVDEARSRKIDTLYLLTEGASGFFARLGFEPVSREDVPQEVEATDQFQTLCPDSATCMKRRLDPNG